MKKFKNFWNDLHTELRTSKKINNWTMKKGFFGEDFTAQVKNPNTILCTTLKGSEQSVSMKNFRLVYDDWEGYLSGNVKRKDWIPHTRFSKYTISIIHQYLK